MINYEEITENLKTDDIIRLMTDLGADRYKDVGNAIIFPTICHNEDAQNASMKLYYYKNSHMFYCYTDEGSMSIFKFLRNYYETRQLAYDWYNDILQVVLSCSARTVFPADAYRSCRDKYKPQKSRQKLPSYDKGIMDCFVKYYPIEWLNDHISKKAMDKFNIKFSIAQNKIIIPHYDVDGDLIGIRGRALNKQDIEQFGKYMPICIERQWYSHPLSLNLYGLNWTKENIKYTGICYIFESEKSVLQCENFQMPNCAVAACGSNINKFQIDLLLRTCQPREVVVCFDNEEVEGSKYFNKLYKICQKYKHYVNMSFIYDRNKLTPLKASPSDCGEQIFLQLLKERNKI